MIKAVIFDLDGTLLNTLSDLTESTNFVLSKYNFPIKSIEEINSYVGDGVAKLIERAIPDGSSNLLYEDCLRDFKLHYAKNMFNNTAPYDGILEMLSRLKSSSYKIAVVSNKFDEAVKTLSSKYFQNIFDLSVGENEKQGIRKKPAPDMVLNVINKFGIEQGEAIYVGDSDVDIITAKNSNIDCISVSWGFRDRNFLLKNGAKVIIDSPCEIFNYIS